MIDKSLELVFGVMPKSHLDSTPPPLIKRYPPFNIMVWWVFSYMIHSALFCNTFHVSQSTQTLFWGRGWGTGIKESENKQILHRFVCHLWNLHIFFRCPENLHAPISQNYRYVAGVRHPDRMTFLVYVSI